MTEILTICLHRVVPDAEADANWPWLERGSAITASALQEMLSSLCSVYTPCHEDAVAAALEAGSSCGSRLLWVTFDDGYHDNLDVAAPILEAHGVQPTLFVTAGVLSPTFRLPVDRWYDAVRHASGSPRTIDLGMGPFVVDPGSQEFRQRMVDGPEKRSFVRGNRRDQNDCLRRLRLALGEGESCVRRSSGDGVATYLSAEDLPVLAKLGWRVGGHGRTHHLLPGLKAGRLARELDCEDVRSTVPPASRSRFFAWPDGAFDARVVATAARLLRARGFAGALSIDPMRPFSTSNRWALPRMLAPSHLPAHFASASTPSDLP